MIEVSQKALRDLLNNTSKIFECITFLVGYGLARIRALGGLFTQLIDSLIEGYRFGYTDVINTAITV